MEGEAEVKEAMYTRKGKTIISLSTGVVEDFKSVNKAKKASHGIQKDLDGMLGRGSVRRLAHKNKFNSRTLSSEQIVRMRVGG